MTVLLQALQNVAEGHENRHSAPGKWCVYHESGLVYLEVYPASPVVVTTRTDPGTASSDLPPR